MSRSLVAGALAAVFAGALPFAPPIAMAQPAAQDDSGIVVLAPRVRQTGRSSSTGAPIETLSAQAVVNFSDLNLSTMAGRTELNRRVDDAAKRACDWLNEVYPPMPNTPSEPADCRADAVKRAQDQVKAAIQRAGASLP